MHRLLQRQLKKHFGDSSAVPAELNNFLQLIDEAYKHSDAEKAIIERSLNLSSQELLELNQELQVQKKAMEQSLQQMNLMQTEILEKEKMASLGSLTAGVAHELKNPLNLVINFSESAKELLSELLEVVAETHAENQKENLAEINELSVDLTANLQKIADHGKRADDIIQAMLLQSRGKLQDSTSTDINELIEEAILSLLEKNRQENVLNLTVEKDFSCRIPKINLVREDVRRVFTNLLENSIDAITEKSKQQSSYYQPLIRISTLLAEKEVIIKFFDNGVGIAAERLAEVFTPFFTTKAVGAGLGLSMSQQIIANDHNGSITVSSDVGQSTEVVITLPLILQMPAEK